MDENGLCTYYDLEKNPGFRIKAKRKDEFACLDNEDIASKLLDFNELNLAKTTLYLPKIHCSSCIWLLENLYKLEPGVISSRVNFLNKEIAVTFSKDKICLRKIAEILDSIGYSPEITASSLDQKVKTPSDKSLSYKLGISSFCASNIMMLSFPEYFGLNNLLESNLSHLFSWLNLGLSLPVVFYGASDYFKSAFIGIKNKSLNLDIPIVLGTSAVFLRSVYEVVFQAGPGYFDSLTGLIFFLLIGKWIQAKTYKRFSFERDYLSYFPVAVTVITDHEQTVQIRDLKVNDLIIIRNQEIIPADAILAEGEALIDYSFVTGESNPVPKEKGDLIYAGGRQTGNLIQLTVQKEVSNSYLLQLWNKDVFHKDNDAYLSSFVLTFSRLFTWGTLIIAALTFIFWSFCDPSKVLFSVTSVLLVACPCALALSLPFALSNCLRFLGRNGLFLKSSDVVEKLAEIDTIVFDKTGTLTSPGSGKLNYSGLELTEHELQLIRSATASSTHPLSLALYKHISSPVISPDVFSEVPGKGITCSFGENLIKIGSKEFVGISDFETTNKTRVFIRINNFYKGFFELQNVYRPGINQLLTRLNKSFDLHLLSGDNDSEKTNLEAYFPTGQMKFLQAPTDKLNYILQLQAQGKKILMLGDGLNDAGALKAADVGFSVSEDVYNFSPACDGITEGKKLKHLGSFLRYSQNTIKIIKVSLVLSLFYNAAGLFFAVQGKLSPVVAAILMPLSSVTVVVFVVVFTGFYGLNLSRKL